MTKEHKKPFKIMFLAIMLFASSILHLHAVQVAFNITGFVTSTGSTGNTNAKEWYAVALDSASNIIVAGINGNDYGIVARYTPTGSLDHSFNSTGTPGFIASTDNAGDTNCNEWYTVTLDSVGNILVSGVDNNYNGIVARYTSAGPLDHSFNTHGTPGFVASSTQDTNANQWNGIALDSKGNIIVAGYTISSLGIVARYTPSGSLDHSFNTHGTPGFVTSSTEDTNANVWNGIVLDSEGNIVVPGVTANNYGVIARYSSAGSLDHSFNNTGFVTSTAQLTNSTLWSGITLDSQGNILVAGSTNSSLGVVARYTTEGSLESSFNVTGFITSSAQNTNATQWDAVAFDSAGNIVVTGFTENNYGIVAQYFFNGTLCTLNNWNSEVYALQNTAVGKPVSLLG